MTVEDIALSFQAGLGVKGVAHLLGCFGSAGAIYTATAVELVRRAAIRPELAEGIAAKSSFRDAEKELRYMAANGISAVASTDAGYPPLLRECADFPHVLYLLGGTDPFGGRMVALVGTRSVTPYGQRMCDRLIGRIAELVPDAVIVSGLAYGVDGCVHRAALMHGLRTVAVVANPLPDVTPSQHRLLARQIVEAGGAIVTELPSRTRRNGAYFIPRNRIIAGMCEGTVVVESAARGGSLSTAGLADGYGRSVMAVPGRADDRCSEGANRLIVRRAASMVCCGDDIVRELGWDMVEGEARMPHRPEPAPQLSADERGLLDCFGPGETLDTDTLCQRSGMTAGNVSALLLGMELCGAVRVLPGRMYEKC